MKANERMFPVVAVLTALVVSALLLAACEDGDEEITPSASPTAEIVTATPPRTEAVTATPSPTEAVTATPSPTEAVTVTPSPTEVVTVTPSPTEVVTASPSPTETPCPDTPSILRPEPGAAVPMITEVQLEVGLPEAGDKQPYVLVRPVPDDPNQDYWVQAEPTPTGDCRWISDPVYVGERTDPSGLPFRLCAVVTDEILSRGQRLYDLPQGPSHCIDVTRQ